MQATKSELDELADALRDIVMAARRQASESAHDTAVIALLAHLVATGPLRASELAERACLDPSTVSRHLRSLETDGYLVRTPDPDDGRATRLEVTDDGRNLVRDARQQKLARLGQAVSEWTADDLATLTRLTRKLADSMETL
jgi:DNA-binding MarR family transcriptional regulator